MYWINHAVCKLGCRLEIGARRIHRWKRGWSWVVTMSCLVIFRIRDVRLRRGACILKRKDGGGITCGGIVNFSCEVAEGGGKILEWLILIQRQEGKGRRWWGRSEFFQIKECQEANNWQGKMSWVLWISLRPRRLYFCWSCSLLQAKRWSTNFSSKICIVSKGSIMTE